MYHSNVLNKSNHNISVMHNSEMSDWTSTQNYFECLHIRKHRSDFSTITIILKYYSSINKFKFKQLSFNFNQYIQMIPNLTFKKMYKIIVVLV